MRPDDMFDPSLESADDLEAMRDIAQGDHESRGESCPFCGQHRTHYLSHICADCECHHTEVRIPGEPHIPSYYEAEWNPDCPVHVDRKTEVTT